MFWYFGKFNLANRAGRLTAGFSLLELLVVISIFLIITAIVMVSIPNFRNKSSLDLTASEVATYVRGAQVYGATQWGNNVGAENASYGISLKKDSSEFHLYKDQDNPQGLIDGESYDLENFTIKDLIIKTSSDSFITPNSAKIVFKANDYTSSIGTQLEPSIQGVPSFVYLDIKIVFNRDPSLFRCVRVYNNGQIALTDCS